MDLTYRAHTNSGICTNLIFFMKLSYDLYNNRRYGYLCVIKHCKANFLHVVHTGETIVSLATLTLKRNSNT